MAIAVVNKKQGNLGTMTIAPAAGNVLVMFMSQSASVAEPTAKDNLGTAGWVTSATKSVWSASANSVWVAIKVAVGTETKLEPTIPGTSQGLVYFELSGASTTVDAITAKDNMATAKTATSTAITTTDAGDIVLACDASVTNSGAIAAWTGTGPMTNVEATTIKPIGGSYIPGSTLAAATFTANWETTRLSAMLVVAIKPSSGAKVQTLTATLEFAGTLPRSTTRQLTASVTFTGALPRNIRRVLTAGLSFAGTLGRKIIRGLSGVLSFAGVLTAPEVGHFVKQLAATLTFQGTLQRAISRSQTASLAFQGSLPRITTRNLPAALTFVGALPRATVRTFAAVLAPSGVLKRGVTRAFAASLSFAGTAVRSTRRAFAGTLSFQGRMSPVAVKAFSASLSFAGGLQRSIRIGMRAGLSFLGGLVTSGGRPKQVIFVTLSTEPATIIAISTQGANSATVSTSVTNTIALATGPFTFET